MFFGLKLRAAMLCKPVVSLHGPETANALGRAIADAGDDWKRLLGRLKAQRLSPGEAGAVAAAWIAQNAGRDSTGFDLKSAMTYSSHVLTNILFDAQAWDRQVAVQKAMELEGLCTDEA